MRSPWGPPGLAHMHAAAQASVRSEAVQLVSMALQLSLPSVASQLQNELHVDSVMATGDEPHAEDGEPKHQRPKPPWADADRLSPAIVVAAMMKLVEERMVGRGRVVLDGLNDEGLRGVGRKSGQVWLKGLDKIVGVVRGGMPDAGDRVIYPQKACFHE